MNKLRILGAAKDKLLLGPKSLYIDITTACNINCNFCWIHSPLIKKKPYKKHFNLDFKTIQQVIKTTDNWKTEEISLAGDGEPTLHPQIKEIIAYIKERKLKLYLATNAAFPKTLLPSIAKIDHLYVNLCSPNEESYGKFQAPGNKQLHRRVTQNLRILALLREKHKKPHLNIAFIITKMNYPVIPEMLEYCNRIGINELTFRIIETTTGTESIALSPQDKVKLRGIIRHHENKKFHFCHNLRTVRQALENYESSPFNIARCYTGWFNLLVDFNKNVGICCHNENLIAGNLHKDNIEDIWDGKKAQELRLLCKYAFNLNKYPFKNECDWCHWSRENQNITKEIEKFTALNKQCLAC